MKNGVKKITELELPAGKRILCAVSGGADSMCLLHLLFSRGIDVTAAHFEHGIRGGESLRDAAFVERFCREHAIPCVIEHGDVPAYAAEHALGMEEAARILRYEFLLRAAEERGCELIATAHNADDNAETLLFNLARGSGTAGLRSIPPRRGRIVRPLLSISRSEIEEYLVENSLPHVEDSTNLTDDYTRNLIRHRIVPALREINPRFSEAAARAGHLAARDDEYLCQEAQAYLDEEYRNGCLPLESLRALHPAVSSRALRLLLGSGLSLEHIDAVLAFIQSSEYGRLNLPGRTLRREQGKLFFTDDAYELPPPRMVEEGRPLILEESGLLVAVEKTVYDGEIYDLFKTLFIKYENIDGALMCTARQPGDRLRPAGRGCTKTLKALFSEAGYTQHQRDTAPVFRDAKGVLAVFGLAEDERAIPRAGDKVLKLSFGRIDQKRENIL